jgi:hypothetical protein
MSTFSLLDIAIGMTFLYLLLSLICSAVNELISAAFNSRGKLLFRGVTRLLDDTAFTQMLYEHPLIRNLSVDAHPLVAKLSHTHLPQYIPSRDFAVALMDMIQPGTGARNALSAPKAAGTPITVVNVNTGESLQSKTSGRDNGPTAAPLVEALIQEETVIPSSLKRALRSLIEASGQDSARVRQYIEDWYKSTMDHVAGAYKRRTQYTLFCIGAVITIGLNADSISVAQRLVTNKQLTAIVTSSAQQFLSSRSTAFSEGDAQSREPALVEAFVPKTVKPEEQAKSLAEAMEMLDKVGMPIGWGGPGYSNTLPKWDATFFSNWWALCRVHLVGWFVTALAISFGASFWFDLLNRFMIVRSTVKPHEKSPEEQSKS